MSKQTAPVTEPSTIHDTFVLERNYPVSPDRLFAAFADPAKKRHWFIESHGNQVDHYEMDFRIGGKEQARFRFKPGSPVAGKTCINETIYLDIIPNQRLVFASAMNIGGSPISAALVTAEFLPSPAGTDLVLTHQGAFFPGADGPEMRKGGWQKLLELLTTEFPAAAPSPTGLSAR